MQISINSISNFLIIFLPAFLITGPLFSDLSVVIIDFIFLYILFKERNFNYLNNKLFKFLLIYNVYITILSFFAYDLFFSLKSSITYIRFTIFIFAIKFFLERSDKLIVNFSKIFIITILILFFDSLYQYINGYNILGFKIDNPDKLNSLFGDEGVLGSYLVRFLPLFLVCLLYLNKNKNLFILTIFIFGLLIFLAGSRSSIALYILFFTIFFLIFVKFRKYLFYYLLLLTTLTFLIFSILNINIDKENYSSFDIEDKIKVQSDLKEKISYTIYYNFFDPIKRIFEGNIEKKEIKIFSEVYDAHYRSAYKIFKDNIFFGTGNKMFRKLCSDERYNINEFSCSTHPHNLYLQILAENGLIGFFFVLIIFSYTVFTLTKEFFYRNIKKINKLNDQTLLLTIGVFINFWPIVPFGNFYNNWLSILIYFPIGFLLYFNSKNDK